MLRTILPLCVCTVLLIGARPAQHDLRTLGFMSGCWRSDPNARGSVIEERYSPAAPNLMVGMTRYLRGDSVTSYEFSRIERRPDGTIALTPYPNGVASVSFTVAALQAGDVAFENRAHDFPTRILYRSEGADVLIARIEGNDGRGTEWRMRGFDCDTGSPR
jgi:hypothetical protein